MTTTRAPGTTAEYARPPALPTSSARQHASRTHIARKGALTTTERRGARLAGLGLLSMAVVSVAAVALLDAAEDAASTASAATPTAAATATAGAAFLLLAVLDVLVGWGVYVLLGARARPPAHAALVSRAGYAVLLAAAAARLVWPGGDGVAGFRADWSLALLVFGLHLLITAVALWRSRVAPGVLVVVTALAGTAYLFDDVLARFTDGSWRGALVPLMLGELALMVWLLVVGRGGSATSGTPARQPSA